MKKKSLKTVRRSGDTWTKKMIERFKSDYGNLNYTQYDLAKMYSLKPVSVRAMASELRAPLRQNRIRPEMVEWMKRNYKKPEFQESGAALFRELNVVFGTDFDVSHGARAIRKHFDPNYRGGNNGKQG